MDTESFKKMIKKPFLPIAVIFIVVSLLVIALKYLVKDSGSLFDVLVLGNLVLYVATFFSFNFYLKAINNKNTLGFLKMVYAAMFLKMGICIAAVLVYAFTVKPVSKAAVLIFFGLYFIYTFTEIKIVTRLNKQQKNA